MFEDVWPVVHELLDGSVVSTLPAAAAAVKVIAEANHVIAEGAGAAAVAPALAGKAGNGNIVCVVSGGNIDTEKLVTILEGKVPE